MKQRLLTTVCVVSLVLLCLATMSACTSKIDNGVDLYTALQNAKNQSYTITHTITKEVTNTNEDGTISKTTTIEEFEQKVEGNKSISKTLNTNIKDGTTWQIVYSSYLEQNKNNATKYVSIDNKSLPSRQSIVTFKQELDRGNINSLDNQSIYQYLIQISNHTDYIEDDFGCYILKPEATRNYFNGTKYGNPKNLKIKVIVEDNRILNMTINNNGQKLVGTFKDFGTTTVQTPTWINSTKTTLTPINIPI